MSRRSSSTDDWAEFAKGMGIRLHRFRIDRGLSQESVAYRAGLTRYTYQRYERGVSQSGQAANPSLRSLIALSQVLEIRLDELLPSDLPDVTTR
ncbi:helix-turn-helix domain-containing protein [Microbacterium sp. NPDC089695]|uniref:helix-turn-helix domain-containing protein n=1 Tax=Microbacterium sp. NPDC089695 TaxID=3364198 RepID=UPI0038081A2B